VSDEHEVVEYRDMVAIVRDRVQAMIRKGATVESSLPSVERIRLRAGVCAR
jgi:phage shock protein A